MMNAAKSTQSKSGLSVFVLIASVFLSVQLSVDAFGVASFKIKRNLLLSSSSFPKKRKLVTERLATVYTSGGEVQRTDYDSNDCALAEKDCVLTDNLKERISTMYPEISSSLARLAVAFCPPGHGLQLENLNHVEILQINGDHITISAVLCEDDGCVNVQIPITYPTSCAVDDGFEECILSNLHRLEDQAVKSLQRMEYRTANHEEVQAKQRQKLWLLQTVKDTSTRLQYPHWWMKPVVADRQSAYFEDQITAEDCVALRSLMNEDDFEQDVKTIFGDALFVAAAGYIATRAEVAVANAVVVDVGPSGIIVRACNSLNNNDSSMDLPIQFDRPVTTVSALRTAILRLVSAESTPPSVGPGSSFRP